MMPADTFPWGVSTSRHQQIDHTVAYRTSGPPGQSRVGNYAPMTAFHHRIKTHGGWQVRQPFPGSTSGATPTERRTSSTTGGTRRLPHVGKRSPGEVSVEQALFALIA